MPANFDTAGKPLPHESAVLHVSGTANYTDDLPERHDTLHGAFGLSEKAHARIMSMDLDAVRKAEGVVAVVTLDDVPGHRYLGPFLADEPVFADGVTQYVGQPLFAVAAFTHDQARKAARLAKVTYQDLEPVLDIDTAVQQQSYVLPPVSIARGQVPQGMEHATHTLQGQVVCGGQEQFYLEGQIAMAMPGEGGRHACGLLHTAPFGNAVHGGPFIEPACSCH